MDRFYEILPHSSDLKIRIFGKTKKELFLNAMLAMQQALRPEIKNQKARSKKKIEIKSSDLSSLLVDFLSEINYLNEVEKKVYNDIKFTKFSDTELEGELEGKRVEKFGLQIKGVSWHNFEIKQKNKTWETTILFDI